MYVFTLEDYCQMKQTKGKIVRVESVKLGI